MVSFLQILPLLVKTPEFVIRRRERKERFVCLSKVVESDLIKLQRIEESFIPFSVPDRPGRKQSVSLDIPPLEILAISGSSTFRQLLNFQEWLKAIDETMRYLQTARGHFLEAVIHHDIEASKDHSMIYNELRESLQYQKHQARVAGLALKELLDKKARSLF